MRECKNRKELEQAIKDGETQVAITSKRLYAACKIASVFRRKVTKEEIVAEYLGTKVASAANVEGEVVSSTVVITAIVCIAVVSIVALCLKYDVELELQPDGTLKLKYKKNKA